MTGPKFKQGRYACFTFFPEHHPEAKDGKPQYDPARHEYLVYQGEICPTTGKFHYQGYVQFKDKIKLGLAQKSLGATKKLHMEQQKGTNNEARDYCMDPDKRSTLPEEFGNFKSEGQGKRSDLSRVADAIKLGTPLREVAKTYPETFMRYRRSIREYSRDLKRDDSPRTWPMEVHVRYGAPGTGKTRFIFDSHPFEDVYTRPNDGVWFTTDYVGQRVCVLDEFNPQVYPIQNLLQLLDRYPMQVPCKGDFLTFCSKIIYITSDSPPDQWYPGASRDQQAALLRRITTITRL